MREGKEIYRRVIVQFDPDVECKIERQKGIYTIALRKGDCCDSFPAPLFPWADQEDFFADLRGNTTTDKDGKIGVKRDSGHISAYFRWIKLRVGKLVRHH